MSLDGSDAAARGDLLAARAGELLVARSLRVAVAESCTGGLVLHHLTNIPGSSKYVEGGVVAYSNEAKVWLLGVRSNTLRKFGAVSEPAAREMARGVRLRLKADVGLAITGIAGPGGGSPDKPVGLVYIALSTEEDEWCERHIWTGNRLANKQQSALAALDLLLRYLAGDLGFPV